MLDALKNAWRVISLAAIFGLLVLALTAEAEAQTATPSDFTLASGHHANNQYVTRG